MDETQKELENRKKKILNKIIPFMKEPLNLALVTVLLFAFVLRLYYFIKVGNQPLWWDELCYGSLAKNFITHTWDSTTLILGETAIRPVLFPLLWSILLRVGIPEGGVRFFLEFIPSILSVFFVYLIGKETFNKRVGIISAFIFSVLWIHLFYTVRLLTHAPALVFLFSSIYLFMKATETKFNFNLFTISLILLSLSTLMRYPKGIIFFVYLFMLVIDKKLLLKNFKFWKAGILGISPMIVFFIYNFVKYQNIFPALLGGGYLDKGGSPLIKPIAFNLLNFIPVYLKTTFFIFFLIGLLLILFELITGYNLIPKIKKLKNSLILILILILIYSFFIFYIIRPNLITVFEINTKIEQLKSINKLYGEQIDKIAIISSMAEEIQAEKLVSLGTMSAGIAHEINNPLTGILGFAQLSLKQTAAVDPQYQNLKYIETSALQCKKIIGELLIYAGREKFKFEPVNINKTIESAVSLVEHIVKTGKIEIIKQFSGDLPFVSGRRPQLELVFANMIRNAADAMTDGGKLTITTKSTKMSSVEISFTDTGAGISGEGIKKIFDPFFTTKSTGSRTGLGLSISLGIIKSHSGDIKVVSEVNKGSTFTVILPV